MPVQRRVLVVLAALYPFSGDLVRMDRCVLAVRPAAGMRGSTLARVGHAGADAVGHRIHIGEAAVDRVEHPHAALLSGRSPRPFDRSFEPAEHRQH